MDLRLESSVAKGYKSQSQIARRISEEWADRNLYCLACTSWRRTGTIVSVVSKTPGRWKCSKG